MKIEESPWLLRMTTVVGANGDILVELEIQTNGLQARLEDFMMALENELEPTSIVRQTTNNYSLYPKITATVSGKIASGPRRPSCYRPLTAAEALVMGVTVVTIEGREYRERMDGEYADCSDGAECISVLDPRHPIRVTRQSYGGDSKMWRNLVPCAT